MEKINPWIFLAIIIAVIIIFLIVYYLVGSAVDTGFAFINTTILQ